MQAAGDGVGRARAPWASLFLSVVSPAYKLPGSWTFYIFTQSLKGAFPKSEAGQAVLPFMISLRSHTVPLLPHSTF